MPPNPRLQKVKVAEEASDRETAKESVEKIEVSNTVENPMEEIIEESVEVNEFK